MSFFPIRLISLQFILIACALSLAGCGLPKAVGNSVGKAMGEGIAKGMGCALNASLGMLGSSVGVSLEQSTYDQVSDFIRKNGIGDEKAFYAKVDANSAAFLRKQIADAYDKLEANSSLRAKPVAFYQDLYGYGLVQAAKENLALSQVTFIHAVGTDRNGTISYETYRVSLTIEHPRAQGSKGYARCE